MDDSDKYCEVGTPSPYSFFFSGRRAEVRGRSDTLSLGGYSIRYKFEL